MATRRVEFGPTGKTLAYNVRRIRTAQKLTLRDVAERLANTDRPLAHNTINEIEREARRADADDIIALSVVLNCSPLALLLPPTSADYNVTITGATKRPGWEVWAWGRGERPLLLADQMESTYPQLGRSDRIRAMQDQYAMNTNPEFQGIAGAPNVHPVKASSSEDSDDGGN